MISEITFDQDRLLCDEKLPVHIQQPGGWYERLYGCDPHHLPAYRYRIWESLWVNTTCDRDGLGGI